MVNVTKLAIGYFSPIPTISKNPSSHKFSKHGELPRENNGSMYVGIIALNKLSIELLENSTKTKSSSRDNIEIIRLRKSFLERTFSLLLAIQGDVQKIGRPTRKSGFASRDITIFQRRLVKSINGEHVFLKKSVSTKRIFSYLTDNVNMNDSKVLFFFI